MTSPGKRVPPGNPMREIKRLADAALRKLGGLFDQMYDTSTGRPSIPPERLLNAQLLIALYAARSERKFIPDNRRRVAPSEVSAETSRSRSAKVS